MNAKRWVAGAAAILFAVSSVPSFGYALPDTVIEARAVEVALPDSVEQVQGGEEQPTYDITAYEEWSFDEETGTLTISESGEMYNYGDKGSPWKDLPFTSLVIEDGVTGIGDYAFAGCGSLTSVTIPDSVTRIGRCAFMVCESLRSVTIPDSVTSIEAFAFDHCSSLTSVTIPDSVTEIGVASFQLTKLTSVTIPDSITYIPNYCFASCYYLTSVMIPESVTIIYPSAFAACASLASITIENPDCKVTYDDTIYSGELKGDYYFNGTIYGYKDSTAQSYANLYDYEFESIDEAPGSEKRPTSGSCGDDVTWSFNKATGTLTIQGTGEMYDCTDIFDANLCKSWFKDLEVTSVVIEDGVTSIGERVFKNCTSLRSVTIPDSVTNIGNRAFYGCSSLTSVTFPDSIGYIRLGRLAFNGCSSLTSVTIPDGVDYIGDFTFYGCSSLTSVTIPDSVRSIGYSAFGYCTSLNSVTILDPDCEIYDDSSTICNGNYTFTGTIYGYENSTAQAYAEYWGYKFEIIGTSTDPTPATGDLNSDSTLDLTDLILFQKYLLAVEPLTADQLSVADFDGDGVCDVYDLALMKWALLS